MATKKTTKSTSAKTPKKCSSKASAKTCCCSAEDNLKKLAKTTILSNFVKKNEGCWNHQKWLDLCALIESKGYSPIDFDQVGLLLEDKKAKYSAKK